MHREYAQILIKADVNTAGAQYASAISNSKRKVSVGELFSRDRQGSARAPAVRAHFIIRRRASGYE